MQRNPKEKPAEKRAIDKSLIFVKSTVVALFLVLVTLVVILIVVKNKQQATAEKELNDCAQSKVVSLEGKIKKIDVQGSVITILTGLDKKTGKQQIVRLEASCGKEINRINLNLKHNSDEKSERENDQF